MRRALTVVPLMLLLTACSSSSQHTAAPTTTAVAGSVTLAPDLTVRDADPVGSVCYTSGNSPVFARAGAWDEIKAGAQVVITDAAGATVGVGTLSAGRTTTAGSDTEHPPCVFTFTVPSVRAGGAFYGVKIGPHSKQIDGAALPHPVLSFP